MSGIPGKLYHATLAGNMASILEEGLLASKCGAVHGETEVHPSRPRVYLSAHPEPDNLCAELFAAGDVVVLEVDATGMDPDLFYPDDFFLDKVAAGEMLEDVDDVMETLGLDESEARSLLDRLEHCEGSDFAEALKPFAAWHAREHGEVSYVGDVPPDAIVSVRPYDSPERDAVAASAWVRRSAKP